MRAQHHDSRCAPSPNTGDAQPSPMTGSERGRGGGRPVRVVIAEDAALFREGLARLITDRGHAVVDIRMPPTHTDEGLRAAIELRREHPGTGVLVLSQYVETRYAARLLEGNAAGVGYLLKDRVADVAEFAEALTRVAAGGTALDPEVVSQLLRASRHSD